MESIDLYEMLDKRRQELGLSQADLGQMILGERSTSVMQNIRRGASPSADRLAALCEALQLEFYVGPPREAAAPSHLRDDTLSVDGFDLQVSAGAGALSVAAPTTRVPFSKDWLRRHNIRPAEVAFLEVRGDSMEPVLYDADAILVDKAPRRPVSGKMYVVVRGDNVQVKWVIVKRKTFTLESENDAYPPERVDPLDHPEFYRVRWFGHFIR